MARREQEVGCRGMLRLISPVAVGVRLVGGHHHDRLHHRIGAGDDPVENDLDLLLPTVQRVPVVLQRPREIAAVADVRTEGAGSD